jgi:hypothetical protein
MSRQLSLSLTGLGVGSSTLDKLFTAALLYGRRRIISNPVDRNTSSRAGLDRGGNIEAVLLKEDVQVVASGIANRVRNHNTALTVHKNRARHCATEGGSVSLFYSSVTALIWAAAILHH